MRTAIASILLLSILLTGCEKEKDPVEFLRDPFVELTDGFCLLKGDTVVLNHHDIEYYDYGAHLVYLKNHILFSEFLEAKSSLAVYAGGEEIYTIYMQPSYSSYMPEGPIIWTHPTFYEDYVIAIDQINSYDMMMGTRADCRGDSRIVEALKKYGQYREGLQCEISSIQFSSGNNVVMKLKLSNGDSQDYYYLDPEKMGMGLFHYFTNGLSLWDDEAHISYQNQMEHIQPEPWDSWELDWLSVLEGGDSVTLSISYGNFEEVPPGTYSANCRFPGLTHVELVDLDQKDGRIWLGTLELHSVVLLE
jgi:hypothetical protein